jgi:hypothetical protein
MKRFLVALLIVLMTAGFAGSQDEEKLTCSIVFDYTGSLTEVGELVNWIMENLDTATLTQIHGEPYVIYCTSVDKCKKVPGTLGIKKQGVEI